MVGKIADYERQLRREFSLPLQKPPTLRFGGFCFSTCCLLVLALGQRFNKSVDRRDFALRKAR